MPLKTITFEVQPYAKIYTIKQGAVKLSSYSYLALSERYQTGRNCETD
jgi:hypothetical protein